MFFVTSLIGLVDSIRYYNIRPYQNVFVTSLIVLVDINTTLAKAFLKFEHVFVTSLIGFGRY